MTKQEIQRHIGHNIKRLRLEKNISLVSIASQCNMEKSNFSRLESGGTNPTLYTLYKISEVLQVATKDLIPF